METLHRDVVVIGAGLTGLTTAFHLTKKGLVTQVIDKNPQVGGQIRTFRENGYVFESGPNTGVVSYPEVAELFSALAPDCELENARSEAKRRLIWKGNRFHEIPSGPISAITTPLFSLSDKFRILGEPFRAKGTNPEESVAELACRRLGKSFLDYAVDPFLSGVYAGNPHTLITKYALPKLYNLEQTYGGFIRGTIAKSKLSKTDRDKLATKNVFSARGGLDRLPQAMAKRIGNDFITLNANNTVVSQDGEKWIVTCHRPEGEPLQIHCRYVITTVGAYSLPSLLPFIDAKEMSHISNLEYAPVIQVSVGIEDTGSQTFNAFGGLVPSKEKKNVLGILYPSACFENRAPERGALFSFFIGGKTRPDLIQLSDNELKTLVTQEFHDMLKLPTHITPTHIRIFRHNKAIPQYEKSSGKRFETIDSLEKKYPGLILAGNIKGGIGMADRIKQGTTIAETIAKVNADDVITRKKRLRESLE